MGYRVGTHPGARPRVPGLYQHLLDVALHSCAGPDPRVYVSPDNTPLQVAALLVTQRRSPRLELLEAGLPVVVAAYEVTGNWHPGLRQQVPWLSGRGNVKVRPDDTIEPTDEEWTSTG